MDRSENGISNLLANRMPSLNNLSSNLQQLRTDLATGGANNNQLNNANLMNAFNLAAAAGLPQLAGLWNNNQLISAMSQYMDANNSLLNLKQESSLENNQKNLKRSEDDDLENKCNKDVLDLKINHSNKRLKNDGFVQNEQPKQNLNTKLSKDGLNFLDNGRSYPCPECHKTFATEVDLKMHLLRHVIQHPFSCSTCGKGFKYEHTLAFHEKQHGIDSSNKLNLKNSNKKSLPNHQQQKNDLLEEKALFINSNRKLKYPSTTSSSTTKLQQNHLEDEDLDNIPANLLVATTSSAISKLNNSITSTNSKQLNQNSSSLFSSSTDSNASFDFGFPNSTIPNLGIQMKSEKVLIVMVEGVNPLNDQTYTLYKCNICGFAFANLAPVTEHIMTVHSNNQKFNCDKCGANFKWRNELVIHDQIHKAVEQQQVVNNKLMINNLLVNQYLNASGDLKLDSNNNDNLLLNSNNLNGHLMNGDKLLDKNNLIGLNLTKNPQRKDSESSQESLNLIANTKTKNVGRSKELRNDELDELSKKIAVVKQNTSNDELGEIEETAPGQFKCRYCDKTFDRVFSVHRHERVHTGFKPCICKVCGKGFSELRNLRHHLIRFHSDGSGRELLRRVRKDKSMNIEENNEVKRQLKAMEMNILSMNNNSLQSNTGSDEDSPLSNNSKDHKQANGDHDTNSNHSEENLNNNNHKTTSSSRRRKSVPYKVNTNKVATSTSNSTPIIEQMDTEEDEKEDSSSRSDQASIKDEDSNNGCNNDEQLND